MGSYFSALVDPGQEIPNTAAMKQAIERVNDHIEWMADPYEWDLRESFIKAETEGLGMFFDFIIKVQEFGFCSKMKSRKEELLPRSIWKNRYTGGL